MGGKMRMKIYRDADGKVINIGDWDYKITRVPELDPETQQPLFQRLESGDFVPKTVQKALNPLPTGATEGEADVEIREDGGLYVADT